MECPICYEVMNAEATKLNCGHIFHTHCIERWAELNCTCPYCRFVFHHTPPKQPDDMALMMIIIVAYTWLMFLIMLG